jgi:hypothetical protein
VHVKENLVTDDNQRGTGHVITEVQSDERNAHATLPLKSRIRIVPTRQSRGTASHARLRNPQ